MEAGSYPFSQGGNNTTGNKDKLRSHPRMLRAPLQQITRD